MYRLNRTRRSADEKIAQELLRKELPLRIRLLGIRLSTLKDLTVEDKGIRKVCWVSSASRR